MLGDIAKGNDPKPANASILSTILVRDGCEAMDFLQASGQFTETAFRPDLVILDLNMPKKDGRTLLGEMKAIPNLKTIPVLILTMSSAEKDICQSYNLNASCYLVKPLVLSQFTTLVRYIENFWFNSVKYPTAATADDVRFSRQSA